MTLKKTVTVDRIEVLENGCVQVRTKTAIFEGDKQISGAFHRHVVVPGADYSEEDVRVQAVCAATHTLKVIEAYKTAQKANATAAAS